MEREMAQLVVNDLVDNNGPMLSLLEAMEMTKVETDGYEVYASQKGDVTFLAWFSGDIIHTKTIAW